jgi:hypothetical protein
MEHPAHNITRRANALNVSISQLCEMSGVSRNWFEKLKGHIPRSISVYMKVNEQLRILEQKQPKNN